jgi:hypothetical protein
MVRRRHREMLSSMFLIRGRARDTLGGLIWFDERFSGATRGSSLLVVLVAVAECNIERKYRVVHASPKRALNRHYCTWTYGLPRTI